jgi:hypothetical protein
LRAAIRHEAGLWEGRALARERAGRVTLRDARAALDQTANPAKQAAVLSPRHRPIASSIPSIRHPLDRLDHPAGCPDLNDDVI